MPRIRGSSSGAQVLNLSYAIARATSVFLFATCVFAQEAGAQVEQGDPWLVWKWINFAILAVGLGYLIRKHAPALFRRKAEEIERAILEATKARKEAEVRAAAIAQRLAGLENEIESLREAARAEVGAEGDRISRETARRLESIQAQAKQEIALMSRGVLDELRKYSAQLALDLAQERIRARMNTERQDRLVDGFLGDLRSRLTPGARN